MINIGVMRCYLMYDMSITLRVQADLLGDRIAIMGDGQLRCCGSPLFLKRAYGVGYNITLEKECVNTFNYHSVMDMVSRHVDGAKLLTNVGTEMSLQLPFSGSSGFQALFECLDDNMASVGVKSYGMSVTTLEEVFLKVASGTTTITTALQGMAVEEGVAEEEVVNGEGLEMGDRKDSGQRKYAAVPSNGVDGPEGSSALVLGTEMRDESPPQTATPLGDTHNDPESLRKTYELDESAKIGESKPVEMFLQHMRALLTKRYLYFIRDSRSWCFQFALPIIFVLGGCLLMHFTEWAPEQPEITISPKNYNKAMSSNFLPLPFTAASAICPIQSNCSRSRYAISGQQYIMDSITDSSQFPMEPQFDGLTVYNISNYLLKNRDQYQASRFGAITFKDVVYNDTNMNSGAIQRVQYMVHGNYTGVCSGLSSVGSRS